MPGTSTSNYHPIRVENQATTVGAKSENSTSCVAQIVNSQTFGKPLDSIRGRCFSKNRKFIERARSIELQWGRETATFLTRFRMQIAPTELCYTARILSTSMPLSFTGSYALKIRQARQSSTQSAEPRQEHARRRSNSPAGNSSSGSNSRLLWIATLGSIAILIAVYFAYPFGPANLTTKAVHWRPSEQSLHRSVRSNRRNS